MSSVGFEPTISAGERPKTYALDCTATGTGKADRWYLNLCKCDTKPIVGSNKISACVAKYCVPFFKALIQAADAHAV